MRSILPIAIPSSQHTMRTPVLTTPQPTFTASTTPQLSFTTPQPTSILTDASSEGDSVPIGVVAGVGVVMVVIITLILLIILLIVILTRKNKNHGKDSIKAEMYVMSIVFLSLFNFSIPLQQPCL